MPSTNPRLPMTVCVMDGCVHVGSETETLSCIVSRENIQTRQEIQEKENPRPGSREPELFFILKTKLPDPIQDTYYSILEAGLSFNIKTLIGELRG